MFPFKYMGAVMLGNGLSGVSMNGLKAVLMAILPGPDNMFYVALIFFILSTLILFACGYAYHPMYASPFF